MTIKKQQGENQNMATPAHRADCQDSTSEVSQQDDAAGTLFERLLRAAGRSAATGLPPGQDGEAEIQLHFGEAKRRGDQLLKNEGKSLGRAAYIRLSEELNGTAMWVSKHWLPEKGDFGRFASLALHRSLQKFRACFKKNALWREWCDQEKRDAAVLAGPTGCKDFLEQVDRRVRALQQRASHRWYIDGLESADVRQEVAIAILEAVSRGSQGFAEFERAGCEATYLLLQSVRSRLSRQRQKERRWRARDARAVELVSSAEPTPEIRLCDQDSKQQLKSWPKQLCRQLSQPQQRWLRVLLIEAARPGEMRWAPAAKNMGRDKSSATRVVEVLQSKLNRLNARELLR